MLILFILILAVFIYFIFKMDKFTKNFDYKNNLYSVQNDITNNADKKYVDIPNNLLNQLMDDSYRALNIIKNKENILFILLQNRNSKHFEIMNENKKLALQLNSLTPEARKHYLALERKIYGTIHSYFKKHSVVGRTLDKLKESKNRKISCYCLEIDNTINNTIKTYHI